MGTAKTQFLQERRGANAGRTSVRPPAPHFPAPNLFQRPKREDEGREGAISGRLARKTTDVSPSGFARTDVLAGKEGFRFPWTVLKTENGNQKVLFRGDGWSSRKNDKARNGGRQARSAAKPQSDRWSPKRFAPPLASLRFPLFWCYCHNTQKKRPRWGRLLRLDAAYSSTTTRKPTL